MIFRKLLIGGHVITLILAATTAAIAIGALRLTTTHAGAVARELAESLTVVQRLHYAAERVVASGRGYILTGEPADATRFAQARDEFERELVGLRDAANPSVRVQAIVVEQTARAYELAAATAGGARAEAYDVIPFYARTVRPGHDAFETAVAAFVAQERARFEAELGDTASFARTAELSVLAIAAGMFVIGIVLARKTVRRLADDYARIEAARATAAKAVAARDDMIAIVSHDLRSPLQTIALGAELLNQTCEGERSRHKLQMIGSVAGRMSRMVDALVEVARLDASALVLHRTPCEVTMLVDEIVDQLAPRAAAQHVHLDADSSHAEVLADRERILEVLANLVDNALKHTASGGDVHVHAEARGDDVRFAVEDTGKGIAAEHLPHLFDRYWQVDPEGRGVGLGLYICKRLVEAHRGTIGVTSTPERGTEFWFTLPRTT